jgi:hypothetical protein
MGLSFALHQTLASSAFFGVYLVASLKLISPRPWLACKSRLIPVCPYMLATFAL